jgi:hypothetical protein
MDNLPKEVVIDADALKEYYVACQNTIDTTPDEIVMTKENMTEHYRAMYGLGFM